MKLKFTVFAAADEFTKIEKYFFVSQMCFLGLLYHLKPENAHCSSIQIAF